MQQIETWSQSTEQSRGFKLKQQKENQRWCLTPTGSHRSSAEQILLQLTHKVSTFYFYCCHVQSAPLRIGSPPPSPPVSPSLSPSFTPSRHRSPSPRHKESFLRRKTMLLIKRFLNGHLCSNLCSLHPSRTWIIWLTHNYPCINECIIIHIQNCYGKRDVEEKGGKRLIVNSFMTDKQSNRSICV